MEEAAKFLFIRTAAVALFTFLTVSHWISTRAAERRDRERMALLRKVAEQPVEMAALMRELLREEDWRDRMRILILLPARRDRGDQAGCEDDHAGMRVTNAGSSGTGVLPLCVALRPLR